MFNKHLMIRCDSQSIRRQSIEENSIFKIVQKRNNKKNIEGNKTKALKNIPVGDKVSGYFRRGINSGDKRKQNSSQNQQEHRCARLFGLLEEEGFWV